MSEIEKWFEDYIKAAVRGDKFTCNELLKEENIWKDEK